ncbi:MAG: DEAD/DEAH box helicase family protein [Barnesiella sp.]|nr:DEAD/DEAH box helicase family protein [Barnesiella sp.]
MITLRENQTEPIQKAIAFFQEKKPKPSLIVLPTAWGKSILTAFVAQNTTDKLLVIQPSKELLEQNYKKYDTLCGGFGSNAGIYSASFNRKEIAQITYATIGSIKNLGEDFKKHGFTKMLIDEAHLYPREADSMLGRFLKDSGITHVLGITATPVKLQTNRDRGGETYSKLVMLTSRSKKGNFFKEIIHVGQVSEMVNLGFWSKLSYKTATFDDSLLQFNSSKSEYTEESVQQAYDANGGSEALLRALDSIPDRNHILVFTPSVADAVALSEQYPNSGVIYGEMDKAQREQTIADFKAGRLRVIFNVRVLSTGFDYTGIDCILLGISTASIALYYQIIGRATRIDDNKQDALIWDFGGNVERFGRVEDITFEKGKMWRMFGTGGKLLSGIPIDQIGRYTREDTIAVDNKQEQPIEVMPFGKYQGQKLKDIPLNYRQWMIRTFDWNSRNEKLRKSIVATL